MGVILRANGVSFESDPIGFIPPVSRGLLYWGYLGGSAENAVKNLAPGMPDATIVGAPAFSAGYASLGKANHLKTQAVNGNNTTLIAVARMAGDASAVLISNTGGPRPAPLTGTSYGASLWYNNFNAGDGLVNPSFNQNVFDGTSGHPGTTTTSTAIPAIPVNRWDFFCGSFNNTTKVTRMRTLSAGGASATSTANAPNNVPDVNTAPFGIGHGYSDGLGTVEKDMAFVAIYDTVLTEDEVQAIYAHTKTYLAKRGIVV